SGADLRQYLDAAICSERIPDCVAERGKDRGIGSPPQPAQNIEPIVAVDGNDPLGRAFDWAVVAVGQGNPEPVATMLRPEAPAIVLLDWIGEGKSGSRQMRERAPQPLREVLAEAAII